MDIEVTNPSPPSADDIMSFNFSLPPSNPHASLEEALNLAPIGETNISMEFSSPLVIPYSANVPADPSLWDGNFTATFLFSTNKFLNSNINNIMCFLRQRNLEGCNANNIRQLDLFGKSAWDFILAIFESGWDMLTTSNDSSIRNNVARKFGKSTIPPIKEKVQNSIQINKVPVREHLG